MCFITVYHYTDDAGYKGITGNDIIRASRVLDGGDAALGRGVYVTKKDPWRHTKGQIAANNWDSPNATDKCKYCIKIRLGTHRVVQGRNAQVDGRDVWVYTKGDQQGNMPLKYYKYKYIEVGVTPKAADDDDNDDSSCIIL